MQLASDDVQVKLFIMFNFFHFHFLVRLDCENPY